MDGIIAMLTNSGMWLFMFIGVIWGLLIGVMPGVGSMLAMAIILPFTFGMSMENALIVLMSTYTSCLFGGAITACLLGIPGTGGNIITTLDGYPMTQQGKAGLSVGIAVLASAIGQWTTSIMLLMLAAPFVAFALKFGPHELFLIALWGFIISVGVTSGNVFKNLVTGCIGIVVSCIGLDPVYGIPRLTFGSSYLLSGVPLIPAIMGIFGFGIVIQNIVEEKDLLSRVRQETPKLSGFRTLFERSIIVIMIVSVVIGFIVGVIPGTGTIVANLLVYGIFKRLSRRREEYGKGCYEGVFIAEASNNAVHPGAVLMTVVLGIPGSSELVILLGAFTLHGLRCGPLLLVHNPQYLDAIFITFMLSAFFSLVVVWSTLRVWVKAIETPKTFLWPLVLLMCIVGTYSIHNEIGDVVVALSLGVLAMLGEKRGFSKVPFIMGLVLGPILEENFRLSLIMLPFHTFFTKPIYIGFWIVIIVTSYIFLKGVKNVQIKE